MSIVQAIILAIIEGITEFLPISSTGHMILASSLMGIGEDDFVKTFEISIQLGAILAIVLMYARRFLQGLDIYFKLGIAFLPSALIGFIAYSFIKTYLFNPIVVSVSLILGGLVLILIDKAVDGRRSKIERLEDIPVRNAIFIGLFQCLAMVPGVSRAAATIIGGLFNGLDKKQAMEFSFLLAVPTMLAATGYDLLQSPLSFSAREIGLLTLGMVLAFASAWVAVKFFLKIVEKYGFKEFGIYRIVIGLVYLLLMT